MSKTFISALLVLAAVAVLSLWSLYLNKPSGRNASSISNTNDALQAQIESETLKQGYKNATTTLFWVGETADGDNGYIPNASSAWDSDWQIHFGGVDDPRERCGYFPCAFAPDENPFYFALPYADFDKNGNLKSALATISRFATPPTDDGSHLKNSWIEILYAGKRCYAQWEDVGPFETDDFEYVFGNAEPKNQTRVGAGLDVSPAVWTCLGMKENNVTSWRFVRESDVPAGPWKMKVTKSGIFWR